ncbi:MAG: P-II family nitrogen regulator [Magnetococcales bacterium]|nr:P-II family nitrogen regulator [Magnetococcales bacterium]
MNFHIVIAIIKSEMTEKVIKVGKSVGAPGATVIPARGTGTKEAKTFFGINLDISRDVILFIVEERLIQTIQKEISQCCSLDNPGTGVTFSLPIANVIGLSNQIPHIEELIAKQLNREPYETD